MIQPIHSPSKSISFQAKPLPKTVIITSKNGKDIIKDEFVGYYYQRKPFLELALDIINSLADILNRFIK